MIFLPLHWTKVGSNLFELKSKSYLVVDYTTNFFDINLLPNKRSATIVTHLKRISKFGILKKALSDNGPEYIGKDYKLFAKQWNFEQDSSSLITKNLMDKLKEPFRQ